MASIVSSVFTIDNLQVDGRRSVIETHTDDSGNEYRVNYIASSDVDMSAKLQQHAADLDTQLQAQ